MTKELTKGSIYLGIRFQSTMGSMVARHQAWFLEQETKSLHLQTQAQKRKGELEAWRVCIISRPAHNDMLSLEKLDLSNIPNTPPIGDEVFQYLSLWKTFLLKLPHYLTQESCFPTLSWIHANMNLPDCSLHPRLRELTLPCAQNSKLPSRKEMSGKTIQMSFGSTILLPKYL